MKETVIIGGARTPFGAFGGRLASFSAAELGGVAIKGALDKTSVTPSLVQEVIMGNVLQGGQGQLSSRQAAHHADIPWEVQTETINKVCASGMRSVTLADQIIRAGDTDVIVAGGMESMSRAPYLMPNVRWGQQMGDTTLKDMMVHDGLTCPFQGVHMGVYGNDSAETFHITREMQDEWADRSHKRVLKAMELGRFDAEIISINIPQKWGATYQMTADESVRPDTTFAALQKLKPVFSKDGTITAGNAPGVNDGACAMVLMSSDRAKTENKAPLAKIVAHTALAMSPKDFPQTPGLVIKKLLKEAGKKLVDIEVIEINEAFAAVALVSSEITGIDSEKVNVNGGAVAIGHPIGASGARIVLTLAHELKRRGGGVGIAAICSGGGQGDAVMIEV